ncbi:MAG: PQQ-binding-like beta-propeller repeat protein [Pirellulales bacterium]|nr:PQQ-binding-like beta-propeller repeat protein [Pirellulales bacterium]
MNINDFLDILQQRDLVAPAIVDQLRQKASAGDGRVTPQAVLKYLVKNELVSRDHAKQLLKTALTVAPHAESSILGVAPKPAKGKKTAKHSSEETPTLKPEEPTPPPAAATSRSQNIDSAAPLDALGDVLSKSMATENPHASFEETATNKRSARAKKRKAKRAKDKSEWDSPLLLAGGGGLLALLIVGIVVYILINREDAEAVLSEASVFFEDGSYTQAIKQYEHFVEAFPNHPQFSTAKVKLGIARLWKATRGADSSNALHTAQDVLDTIQDEEEFKSAQRDLASLLPEISRGLAADAENASSAEEVNRLVGLANVSLGLCTNTKFISKKFRDEVILDEVRETLVRVKRTRLQKERLAAALLEIQVAIEAQDTAKAYQIHKQLIDENPGLLNNETLAAKLSNISAAEAAAVAYVADSIPASTSEEPAGVLASVALAEGNGKTTGGQEKTVAVRIDGALFGLRAADGAVRWRRFLGIAPHLPPQEMAGGDLIVVDGLRHEVLRLSSNTGKLLWRLKLGAPISQPVLTKDRLVIAGHDNRLHIVDSTTGERLGYVQISQKLIVPPAVSNWAKRIYVVGDHSSLYTLSTEDYSCLGVHFLGHAPGSISAAPVAILGKVAVAVNAGVATSHLRILNTDVQGVVTDQATTRRLDGLVNTRLLMAGRRLVALTNKGQVNVYEAGSGEGNAAMTPIATRKADKMVTNARFGLFQDQHVWVAGNQLNKLAVLPTENRLSAVDIDSDYLGDTFDHRLQHIDDLMIHVRRPRAQAGAIVAAMQMSSGLALWETRVAVPLAGAPAIDRKGNRITALSSAGAAFVVDREAIRRAVQDPSARPRPSVRRALPALTSCTDLGLGRLAACTVGFDTLVHFRPDATSRPLTVTQLASPASCRPMAWENTFVVPTQLGQVFLFDSNTGAQIGSPFQPSLSPTPKYHWQTPAIYGTGDDSSLILSDGIAKIYQIKLVRDPLPHLAAVGEADIGPSLLNTRLSVISDLACAGTRAGGIAMYRLPSLEAEPVVELGSQITWGPFAVGNTWIFTTDDNDLVALSGQGKIAWRKPLAHGPVTGIPLADGNDLLLLGQHGRLSRIAIGSGDETGHVDLQQPAIAGPIALGPRLVVAGSDGTLLVLERP